MEALVFVTETLAMLALAFFWLFICAACLAGTLVFVYMLVEAIVDKIRGR